MKKEKKKKKENRQNDLQFDLEITNAIRTKEKGKKKIKAAWNFINGLSYVFHNRYMVNGFRLPLIMEFH